MKSVINGAKEVSLITAIAILSILSSLSVTHCSNLLSSRQSPESRPLPSRQTQPEFVSQALPLTQDESLSSLVLSLSGGPVAEPLTGVTTNGSDGCSALDQYSICWCYASEEGLIIDCKIEAIQELTDVFHSVSEPIKSLSVHSTNDSLVSLPDHLFQNFSSLEQISLSLPSLADLSVEAFLGLEPSLKTLSLVNSKLKAVPKPALTHLKSLSTLDLQSNAIQEVSSYAFHGLPLVSLNLQSNLISALHDLSFGGLENSLSELVLSDNRLDVFPLSALKRLTRLDTLRLQSNRLSEIGNDGLTRFSALKILDLQSNRFEVLDSRSLIVVPNLESLSLANNSLTVLNDSSILESLYLLEALDLSHNQLRVVSLTNLIALRTIDLSNNHLEDIRFHNLSSLKEVFASHNRIVSLTADTFVRITSLSVLFLQHNAIESIASATFHSLPDLITLDLSSNRLKAIDPPLLTRNTRLQSLYLDNNLITDSGFESNASKLLVRPLNLYIDWFVCMHYHYHYVTTITIRLDVPGQCSM